MFTFHIDSNCMLCMEIQDVKSEKSECTFIDVHAWINCWYFSEPWFVKSCELRKHMFLFFTKKILWFMWSLIEIYRSQAIHSDIYMKTECNQYLVIFERGGRTPGSLVRYILFEGMTALHAFGKHAIWLLGSHSFRCIRAPPTLLECGERYALGAIWLLGSHKVR